VQISFHKKNPTEASIIIKIEKADYQVRVASKVEEYRKKATIKGFRPGSVPGTLIQQMYGRAILVEEVNTLLAESLMQYLKDNKIHALGEPMPVSEKIETIDWEHQHDFELEYIVGMPGTFACEFSKKVKVTAYKISHIAAKTVDNLVEQLYKAYGQAEAVSKSTANDVIHGELRYPAQNFKTQTQIVVGEVAGKEHSVFADLSPGDAITFEVKQVFEEAMQLPGVTRAMYATMLELGGQVEFTVEKIHRYTPAVLEQYFFDKVLGPEVARSEEEFRKELKDRLLRSKQKEADLFFEQSMQAILLQKADIALPDDFLRRWLHEKNNTVPKEQIAMYYPQYAKELQWSLLMAALSQKHNLQVTHEEVVGEVRDQLHTTVDSSEVAQQLLEKNMAQLIQKFLQENNGENYRKVYEQVHVHKCINFIQDQITILAQEVSVEEFDKLASE
jgi:trigger factor